MREYLLLLVIAVVGLSGLISIHQEFKVKNGHDLILFKQVPHTPAAQPYAASLEVDQRLVIFQGESWSEVHFDIDNYQEGEMLILDFGNGVKRPLQQGHTQISYDRPGTYVIRLFKDNHLLEANEIELLRPEITL
jgi:hypothetical protein